MNATALYVSTCRYILQADFENCESWADLYRLLPYLRQSLSCCVCGALLDDPQGPSDSTCQHFVCRTCIGGKMLLKPSCSWCKDYGKFSEVRQLRILLSCYKKLCEYIAATPIARSFVGANGESNSTLTILQEGMAINVIHESLNMNPDKAMNILDILAKVNLEKTRGDESKSPGRRRGRRRRESSGVGASLYPLVVDVSDLGNPEVASPSSDSRLDGLSNGLDGSDHLDMSDDHHSFYSASVSNSDTPRIKIKRKHHSSEHKSKIKKKKKKRDKDKVKERKFNRQRGRDSANGRCSSERRKRRHKIHKDDSREENDGVKEAITNGELSSADGGTPKKTLVISGHRAKLLKAGKSLPPIAGCRCGTWNRHPGIYTCFGNRCPCFMEEKGCEKCKCKGCRNPFAEGDDKKKHMKEVVAYKRDMNGESDMDIDVTNI